MMFRIPTITKNLLIINLIAFFATFVLQLRGVDLANVGGLHFFMASDFHLYQPVPTGDLSFPPRQFHAYPE